MNWFGPLVVGFRGCVCLLPSLSWRNSLSHDCENFAATWELSFRQDKRTHQTIKLMLFGFCAQVITSHYHKTPRQLQKQTAEMNWSLFTSLELHQIEMTFIITAPHRHRNRSRFDGMYGISHIFLHRSASETFLLRLEKTFFLHFLDCMEIFRVALFKCSLGWEQWKIVWATPSKWKLNHFAEVKARRSVI